MDEQTEGGRISYHMHDYYVDFDGLVATSNGEDLFHDCDICGGTPTDFLGDGYGD